MKNTKNTYKNTKIQIPTIPKIKVVFPNPTNQMIDEFLERQKKIFQESCDGYGPMNWMFASKWYVSYKLDQANRRRMIRNLTKILSNSSSDFIELTGRKPDRNTIRDGVLLTLKNNLTRANKDTFKDEDLKVFNSLGGVPSEQWLPDVLISPIVP
jgi:hypothetical protein